MKQFAVAALAGCTAFALRGIWGRYRKSPRPSKRLWKGDERFKNLWPDQADRFKDARHGRSPTPGEIVSRKKSG
ncbi:MAG: hypothetical protein ACYSTW_05240 [Planctomycetota bacterium]